MRLQNKYKFTIEDIRKKHTENFALDQLYKFIIVGILNTAIGYGSFFFLLSYFNYIISLIISYILSVTNSYLWNKYWTFNSKKNPAKEYLKFWSIYLITFVINILTLTIWVNTLNFDPKIGQLIVLPILTIISFAGHKYWSFN